MPTSFLSNAIHFVHLHEHHQDIKFTADMQVWKIK